MEKETDTRNHLMGKKWIVILLPIAAVFITGVLLCWFLFGKNIHPLSVNADSMSQNGGDSGMVSNNDTSVTNESQVSQGMTTYASANGISTGNLTELGNGYEGIAGSGDYNYGEALQKSILFYELQRSGNLPDETRCNWRGDSAMMDGSDVGLDLSGGWYDAGDHVKFNLPMAYSATMLGWSVYEDYDAYEESGQLAYILEDIRWVNDYLIKCHPEDEIFYYQVGNGSIDHSWWGPAEVMQMERPSYCVTADNPGSAVTGEAAASLAVCSIVFRDADPEYSELCLEHAISLYQFSESTKSDAGYTQAAGYYDSWSGFYDELSWAGAWLYLATGDETYLDKAQEYYPQAGQDYDWALCWDDVHIGAAVLLAQITENSMYSDIVEQHLDFWTTGTADGSRITYTPQGLAWLDTWGSLRYATTTAYVAAVYSEWSGCPEEKASVYWDFAESQADYVLGDTGYSYQIGFGENYPSNPHHRTAQGSYCNNMNEPLEARHTLYGALVGGPDSGDNYTDEVSNYTTNEVACDYNAGFTGLLAKMYSRYHGETLIDFGAVEEVTEPELYVEAGINVDGADFVEIKAYVYNVSAWPARCPENLELRYFVDLSEVYQAGGSVSDIEVTTNYMQAGNSQGLIAWNEEQHIYYLCVDFSDAAIYPGGQENYKKEIQVRMRNTQGVWDNSNDPSYAGLSSDMSYATMITLYENGNLLFGTEPLEASDSTTSSVSSSASAAAGAATSATPSGTTNGNGNTNTNTNTNSTQTLANDMLKVNVTYDGMGANVSSISGTIRIANQGNDPIALDDLEIEYYLTKDSASTLDFSCYHAAIDTQSGSYQGINGANASFSSYTGTDTDTQCTISFGDAVTLNTGDELTINFCINHEDWSAMNTGNDYSVSDVEHIVVTIDDQVIFGARP